MGFGYGAAIGAQMALGRQQRVVMFTGDGSFHMNLNEACTEMCIRDRYKPRQCRLQPRPAGGDLGRCAGGLDRKMMTRL